MVLIVDSDGGGGFGQLIPDHASTHLPGGSDPLTTGAPTTLTEGASASEGDDASFARQDHVHGTPSTWTPSSHTHTEEDLPALPTLSDNTPQPTGVADDGTGTQASKDDHVHALSNHDHTGDAGDGGALSAYVPYTIYDAKGDLIAGTGSDTAAKVAVGANGTVLTADSGQTAGVKWAVPTANHQYLGYNTVGGSNETVTNLRAYLKKITVPTGGGVLTSIGAHLTQSTDNAFGMMVGVWTDSSGPATLLFASNNGLPAATAGTGTFGFVLEDSATPTYAATWLTMACGLYVPAADYWIGCLFFASSGTLILHYDGSGSDRYWTSGGMYLTHGTRFTNTTSSNKYSLRASLIQ